MQSAAWGELDPWGALRTLASPAASTLMWKSAACNTAFRLAWWQHNIQHAGWLAAQDSARRARNTARRMARNTGFRGGSRDSCGKTNLTRTTQAYSKCRHSPSNHSLTPHYHSAPSNHSLIPHCHSAPSNHSLTPHCHSAPSIARGALCSLGLLHPSAELRLAPVQPSLQPSLQPVRSLQACQTPPPPLDPLQRRL